MSEHDGLDPAKVKAEHAGHRASSLRIGGCSVNPASRETPEDRCQTYRLAALALDLREQMAEAVELRDIIILKVANQRDEARALALDLQGKVARVEENRVEELSEAWDEGKRASGTDNPYRLGLCSHGRTDPAWCDDCLADPTPAARCPQQTPFAALSEPTCTRPEGHEGAHLVHVLRRQGATGDDAEMSDMTVADLLDADQRADDLTDERWLRDNPRAQQSNESALLRLLDAERARADAAWVDGYNAAVTAIPTDIRKGLGVNHVDVPF
jgi:hypothetical protein